MINLNIKMGINRNIILKLNDTVYNTIDNIENNIKAGKKGIIITFKKTANGFKFSNIYNIIGRVKICANKLIKNKFNI